MSYSHPLTRAEAIARHLREEIVAGRLAPGTVIKDAELADRLGVSITPVREAIVLLSAEGLIDISPNRTRRITDVTQKNALELIDVMCVLACAGVEWGVPNLTGADLARMRQRLDDMLAALGAGDGGAATSAGADFSTIMISASGNPGRRSSANSGGSCAARFRASPPLIRWARTCSVARVRFSAISVSVSGMPSSREAGTPARRRTRSMNRSWSMQSPLGVPGTRPPARAP